MSSRITPSIVVPASNNGIWLAKHVLTGQKYTIKTVDGLSLS